MGLSDVARPNGERFASSDSTHLTLSSWRPSVHAREMDFDQPGSVWPAADFDDAQVREVYSRYGLAMFMAQALEHGMVNALLVLRPLPTRKKHADRSSWDEAFDRFYDIEPAKTFGNMARALEQTQAFSPDLGERLRSAKVQRDHLAHRFFREHNMDFMTRPGRTRTHQDDRRVRGTDRVVPRPRSRG